MQLNAEFVVVIAMQPVQVWQLTECAKDVMRTVVMMNNHLPECTSRTLTGVHSQKSLQVTLPEHFQEHYIFTLGALQVHYRSYAHQCTSGTGTQG